MIHYRERFLHEHMGAKIVGLAKRVSQSGVYLHQGGERLDGPEVVRLGKGEAVLFEDDVRAFLQQVAAVGGWDTNPNYVAITEFLEALETEVDLSSLLVVSPMRTQSVVIPPEPSGRRFSSLGDSVVMERPSTPVRVAAPEALLTEAPPTAPAEALPPPLVPAEVLPEVEVQTEEVPASVMPDVVAPSPSLDEVVKASTVSVAPLPSVEAPVAVVAKKAPRAVPKEHPEVRGLRLQSDGFYWNPAWDK